ncbi:hypothetical protein PJI17_32900, partial [Mycobacterium kansasii]
RHTLGRRRERRTPEPKNIREVVAENKDPWESRFADLTNKVLTLQKQQQPTSIPAAIQAMMEETEPPFTSEIMNEVMP